MSLPKILVTGFANSGTSFLCELVAAMGYSPGSACHLKGADSHNPYGYWEHLPLRHAIWSRVGNFDVHKIPKQPVNPARWPAALSIIEDIARQDSVEVYKDCTGPWSYPLLVGIKRVMLIQRDPRILHKRYYADRSLNHFVAVHTAYHDLAAKYMEEDLLVRRLRYEKFLEATEEAAADVCAFLGQPFDSCLLSVFRPRAVS